MYKPRTILPLKEWRDVDRLKGYTISASGGAVDLRSFIPRLEAVKAEKPVEWSSTAAFAIFHEGASLKYLVLAWWGNENELFTSVSVNENGQWIEDPSRYSFCLWDLEVLWYERNSFVRYVYCETPSLETYRSDYMEPKDGVGA